MYCVLFWGIVMMRLDRVMYFKMESCQTQDPDSSGVIILPFALFHPCYPLKPTDQASLRLRHHLSIPIYVSISGLFYMVCTTPSIIRNINLIPYWKSSHIIASIAYERCFPFESYQCRYKIYNNGKSRFQLSLFILNKNPTQKHTLCINLQKHFKRDRLPHCSSLMF